MVGVFIWTRNPAPKGFPLDGAMGQKRINLSRSWWLRKRHGKPCWLMIIGDYTSQLIGDYKHCSSLLLQWLVPNMFDPQWKSSESLHDQKKKNKHSASVVSVVCVKLHYATLGVVLLPQRLTFDPRSILHMLYLVWFKAGEFSEFTQIILPMNIQARSENREHRLKIESTAPIRWWDFSSDFGICKHSETVFETSRNRANMSLILSLM